MHEFNPTHKAILSNLFHLARVALAGSGRDNRYEWKKWAARKYNEVYPHVSTTAAYKELCRQEEWRHV